jgi:hypothetical protein
MVYTLLQDALRQNEAIRKRVEATLVARESAWILFMPFGENSFRVSGCSFCV